MERDLTLEELSDIEKIRTLRNKYAHYLDLCDADALSEIFSEDAWCDFGPYGTWKGRPAIRDNYRKIMRELYGKPYNSIHANANHWIEMTGPNSAAGRCYLIDLAPRLAPDVLPLTWLGLYDEIYVKNAGKWLIQQTSLQFVWPKRVTQPGFPEPFPPVTV